MFLKQNTDFFIAIKTICIYIQYYTYINVLYKIVLISKRFHICFYFRKTYSTYGNLMYACITFDLCMGRSIIQTRNVAFCNKGVIFSLTAPPYDNFCSFQQLTVYFCDTVTGALITDFILNKHRLWSYEGDYSETFK